MKLNPPKNPVLGGLVGGALLGYILRCFWLILPPFHNSCRGLVLFSSSWFVSHEFFIGLFPLVRYMFNHVVVIS